MVRRGAFKILLCIYKCGFNVGIDGDGFINGIIGGCANRTIGVCVCEIIGGKECCANVVGDSFVLL